MHRDRVAPSLRDDTQEHTSSVRTLPPEDLETIPALLGDRYQVLSYLSRGATSCVYLAEDTTGVHGKVVIKMLSPEATHNAEYRKRILREALTVQPIVHPNVIRVLDVNDGGAGVPYVVMESLPGESLGERLRREHCLSSAEVLELARQIAAGLAAVHEAGVVHRDIKPDNLFLTEHDGQPSQIKILDFGMAKVLSSSSSSPHTVLGTAAYMSPEQILVEQVDARSDIYSFGVVLFRMLTGHLPFEATVAADLLRHQLFSPVPPPSWLHEGIDPGLEAIVLRATRKNPDNRYASIAEMLLDLEALLSRRAVSLQPLFCEPDHYEPKSAQGKQAVTVLGQRFGVYSRPPEAGSGPRVRADRE